MGPGDGAGLYAEGRRGLHGVVRARAGEPQGEAPAAGLCPLNRSTSPGSSGGFKDRL